MLKLLPKLLFLCQITKNQMSEDVGKLLRRLHN
jgi:hypothetical protein